jgi:hypothetical protein
VDVLDLELPDVFLPPVAALVRVAVFLSEALVAPEVEEAVFRLAVALDAVVFEAVAFVALLVAVLAGVVFSRGAFGSSGLRCACLGFRRGFLGIALCSSHGFSCLI